ncbi:hypothetical protein O6H91_02G049400 [Diphasiastrum complanatum]|uniref:Uncharacterized protein n=1 Tax=Diphasiastrum complanatum TaxID=34168 RepID=A0ACC2EF68_DIPCM|nr:hypothetical protein O6H91_02G049400 [Diphasiastrum complanatum]
MSQKRKFGFEGFGINKQSTYAFETIPAPRHLYIPSPPRKNVHDNYEDRDVDNIQYEDEDGRALEDERGSVLGLGFDEGEGRAEKGSKSRGDGGGDEGQEGDGGGGGTGGEDEIDPLDAFMEGIHEEVKKAPVPNPKPRRENFENEEDDPMESFLNARRDAGLSLAADALHAGYDSDEEVYAAAKAVDAGLVEYDSDDNAIITVDRKKIEPIPALDHSSIDYSPFSKDFYEEKASISGLSEEEIVSYKQLLAIRVSGFDVPRPIKRFDDLGLDAVLMGAISKQGYENPTPIQCQALPIALSGRDLIGIAKTGSGKTAAFVLPMIVHIMDQEEVDKGEGPIAVICAPTRELAQQIYTETKKFAKPSGLRVSGVFGGMSKFEQFKELKAGCEIVIATPGRLIDMLKMKALTMLRTTYLVLDEADRMFDLGFEPQIRSIVGQIRPDRQTLLFSATMPRRVERLAREILTDTVRVTVGEVGRANEDITQMVTVLPSDAEKMPWLLNKLPEMVDEGDVLVFASTKLRVEEIENQLQEKIFKVAALHGDKDQASRMEVLKKFKSGVFHVLVATDVAARGLDIKSIKSVVNFDIAKDMDSHVHRIGRTGRAGDKEGVAHTLVTQKEARFAGELVNSLIAAGQNVSQDLMDLAMKDGRFRAQREGRRQAGKGGKGRGRGQGKGGGPAASGGGRSVRGVDYGMGIGYNPDAANKSNQAPPKSNQAPPKSSEVPDRGSAVGALKMGMMARFKSSFVAASSVGAAGSGSYAATMQQQSGRDILVQGNTLGSIGNSRRGRGVSGFVSGGSIGGLSSGSHAGHNSGSFPNNGAVLQSTPTSYGSGTYYGSSLNNSLGSQSQGGHSHHNDALRFTSVSNEINNGDLRIGHEVERSDRDRGRERGHSHKNERDSRDRNDMDSNRGRDSDRLAQHSPFISNFQSSREQFR